MKMKQFKEAQEYLKNDYLKREGFSGIFYGYKFVNGQKTLEICLSFHVKEKLPSSQVKKKDRIPKKMDGLITDVVQSNIRPTVITPYSGDYYMETLKPGISIGPEIKPRSGGTWGCVVYDLDNYNEQGILTNHHVLLDRKIEVNPFVMQPLAANPFDDRIAETHSSKYYLGTRGDFAFAILLSYRGIDENMYGTNVLLNSARDPVLGEICKKTGRTTGITTGEVSAIGSFAVTYAESYTDNWYGIVTIDGFAITPLTNPLELISNQGDSGSVWYVDGTTTGVGILTAGSGTDGHGVPDGNPVVAYQSYLTYALKDLNLSMSPETSAWQDPVNNTPAINFFPKWITSTSPQYYSIDLVPQFDMDNLSVFTDPMFVDSIDGGVVWIKRAGNNVYMPVGALSTSPLCNLGDVEKNIPVTLDIMIMNSNNLSLNGEYAIPLYISHGNLIDVCGLDSLNRFKRSEDAETFFYADSAESASWLMYSDDTS